MTAPVPPSSRSPELVVTDVRKRFRDRQILDGVSLVAPLGRVTGLFGPNGAGKTTLFRILMGLVPADGGRAEFDGREILPLPLHRKISVGLGYLPQESRSFDTLTVRQNVLAILEVRGGDRTTRHADLDRLLTATRLTDIADRPYRVLSGGERRRVEVAKALAARPRILLLDEPFAGLDPLSMAELCDLIRSMAGDGIGILLTDHNVQSALEVVERAWLLVDGRILREGAPRSLRDDDVARQKYLGPSPSSGSPS